MFNPMGVSVIADWGFISKSGVNVRETGSGDDPSCSMNKTIIREKEHEATNA
jgi:hypothetical protein